jgi:hypothetical protein
VEMAEMGKIQSGGWAEGCGRFGHFAALNGAVALFCAEPPVAGSRRCTTLCRDGG